MSKKTSQRDLRIKGNKALTDFNTIKQKANGMLSVRVYEKIFTSASQVEGNTIIEVGTAHGASTISLALGLLKSGKKGRIYSFEKIVGGSREKYGGIDENKKIIEDNFKIFEVDEFIKLIIGDVETEYERNKIRDEIDSRPISLLMLDADGAIDRDFNLFYNQLMPGAPIIIDDCNDYVKVKQLNQRHLKIDLKHKLTHELIKFYLSNGILEEIEILENTFFGRKPLSIEKDIDFGKYHIEKVYRELVFLNAEIPKRKSIMKKLNTLKSTIKNQHMKL